MATRILRQHHAATDGPTFGDRVRPGDTEIIIEIDRDLTSCGDTARIVGGKFSRDGQMQPGR